MNPLKSKRSPRVPKRKAHQRVLEISSQPWRGLFQQNRSKAAIASAPAFGPVTVEGLANLLPAPEHAFGVFGKFGQILQFSLAEVCGALGPYGGVGQEEPVAGKRRKRAATSSQDRRTMTAILVVS